MDDKRYKLPFLRSHHRREYDVIGGVTLPPVTKKTGAITTAIWENHNVANVFYVSFQTEHIHILMLCVFFFLNSNTTFGNGHLIKDDITLKQMWK